MRFSSSVAPLLITMACEFVRAASCCGGGFTSASLITGDEKANVTTEFSTARISTEVSSQGIWQDRSSPETLDSFKIQGAHIFRDRFQVAASLPVIRRERAGQTSTGVGDTALNLGYEVLPEWEYSAWRPRGVSYLALTLPTGRSIQESTDQLQLDARGRGFWALGLGTTLTKNIGRFDFVTTLEAHRSFTKEVKNTMLEGDLVPGYGALFAIGAGFNHRDTRFGANLAFNYEDAIETRGLVASPGSPARFATATVILSQMLSEAWSVSASYSDQALFGAPTNTSLARSLALVAQRRFSR